MQLFQCNTHCGCSLCRGWRKVKAKHNPQPSRSRDPEVVQSQCFWARTLMLIWEGKIPLGKTAWGRLGCIKMLAILRQLFCKKVSYELKALKLFLKILPQVCSPLAVRTPSSFVVKFFSSDLYCFNCPGKTRKNVSMEKALQRLTAVLH